MLLMNSTVWAYKANVNGSVSLTLTLYGQIIWTKKNTLPSYAEFVEMQPSAKPALESSNEYNLGNITHY